jgi:hypothetical protein
MLFSPRLLTSYSVGTGVVSGNAIFVPVGVPGTGSKAPTLHYPKALRCKLFGYEMGAAGGRQIPPL